MIHAIQSPIRVFGGWLMLWGMAGLMMTGCAAIQHTGYHPLLAQKIGANDRHDVDFALTIVVSEVGGVFQVVSAAPSGKCRIK